jgi:hypothetical protein
VNQRQLCDVIDTTKMECQKTSDNVRRLRNELMPLIIRSSPGPSRLREVIQSSQSDAQSTGLQVELAKALIQIPSGFEEACKTTVQSLRLQDKIHSRRPLQGQHYCACIIALSQAMTRGNRLSVFFETRSTCGPTCISHFKKKKMWRYMLAFSLLPLLQSTLTLMMTRTSGAGGNSIGVSLSCYRTVKRASSKLFGLFDSFPDKLTRKRCGTILRGVQEGQLCFAKRGDGLELFTFEVSEGDFDGFARSFTELLQQGYGWDKDEWGSTVLHVSLTCSFVAATKTLH